ncbi:MAG: alanine racemase, partial [Pseudomonadota bacterium]|nr:alanine racemase [Pseudomonadota bacterium]
MELNRALVGVTGGAARLQTPALVIDLIRLKNNLETMGTHCQKVGVALRPHTKTHKCAAIAQLQIEAGAQGICCAKLGEAEAMQAAGIQDILVTSPIVTPSSIDRLLSLNESDTDIFAVVDNPVNGTALNDAARKFSTPLKV